MKYEYNGQFYELNIKALDSMPLGMILPYAGDTIPNGYLMCTGQAVSRTEYADLYNVIGEIYGSGDGSTTFNIPDLGGRVPVGLHYGETEFLNLGQSGGSKYLQAHTHNITKKWAKAGEVYGYQDATPFFNGYASGTTVLNSGDVASGVQTGNSGNLQPYLVVHYIIKAKNTVPTMASLVNEESNSTTDGYSCDYVNKALDNKKVLYEDGTGTNGNITLNDDATNYSYLMVYWRSTWNSTRQGVAMAPTFANNWSLFEDVVESGSGSSLYKNIAIYSINGIAFNLIKSNNYNNQNINSFYITKIVGYK